MENITLITCKEIQNLRYRNIAILHKALKFRKSVFTNNTNICHRQVDIFKTKSKSEGVKPMSEEANKHPVDRFFFKNTTCWSHVKSPYYVKISTR